MPARDHHDLALRVDEQPGPELLQALGNGLTEHALPFTGVRGFQPLAVTAHGPDGVLVGGVAGHVNWTWLSIALFWIAPERRRGGLGARLLQEIEDAGRARGCTRAHLDTFSYQARPFYERHGYEVFAILDDYPPGHHRFYLRKTL